MNISKPFINRVTYFPDLIENLKAGFAAGDIIVPMRHHHDFENAYHQLPTTLLLMPAWHNNRHFGVKIISVTPENSKYNLPAIHGSYLLMNTKTGELKSIIDATALTVKRTAAASALAADYLAKSSANSLLMIGTGALAPNLIEAHCSVRPITMVYVWGRNLAKARKVCEQFDHADFEIKAVESIDDVLPKVDIISCATLSQTPLIFGKNLRAGQHIDLVGSFKPDMREADNAVMTRANIYVDVLESCLKETGDLVIPLRENIISEDDIKGDLFQLCGERVKGRKSDTEITVFKSVGHALEDLVAAEYYLKLMENYGDEI